MIEIYLLKDLRFAHHCIKRRAIAKSSTLTLISDRLSSALFQFILTTNFDIVMLNIEI